jgi:short-subunit dehydrogenase
MEVSMSNSKPLALVTGASSGIGAAFARRLARDGHDLIVVGRRRERLDALVAEFPEVAVQPIVADLATDAGIQAVADIAAHEPLALLVNNAGVAHYMAFTDLPTDKAAELLHVKVVAPTLLARAAAPGMIARGGGAIVNVTGMLAFGAMAPLGPAAGRAVYVATLAHIVALSQALHVELRPQGVRIQALCPGIVATEFHERQGMDLSALPRMSADDVVTASLRGLDLGEVVCAPGVEQGMLLDTVVGASLAAFGGQSAALASRYRPS